MPYPPGHIILNDYRLEKYLGHGAFGEVYLATHIPGGRQCAIKLLRTDTPGLGSQDLDELKARFKQEADLGKCINHPNLIRTFDFRQDGDLLALVMEYAPLGDLAANLARLRKKGQAVPLEAALRIASDLARGLAVLHQKDIVHRDLKPGNILFDAKGRARLADLGLAQISGGISIRSLMGSLAQRQPGTPAYMSPEQESQSGLLKPPSDVYALGLVLFEVLTGRSYKLLPPGTPLRSFRPDAPEWLETLLAQMLAESPTQRPWDGDAVFKVLQAGQAGPIPAPVELPASPNQPLSSPPGAVAANKEAGDGQHRRGKGRPGWVWGIGLLLLAALLTSSGIWLVRFFNRPQAAPTIAQAALPTATEIIAPLLATSPSPNMAASSSGTPAPTHTVTTTPSPSATASPSPRPSATLPPSATPDYSPTPQRGATLAATADGMTLIYVPAGTFRMGATAADGGWENEAPVHVVYLDAYWIDQTEVTNRMYYQCQQAGVCGPPSSSSSNRRDEYYPWEPNMPVIYVSWEDAFQYCQWAGRRLPTEAEWEKAARGDLDQRSYPWGQQAPDITLLNMDSAFPDTLNVGNFPNGASPYGALDMAGNVWEWVADWYDAAYYSAYGEYEWPHNPTGPAEGEFRGLRGGSWNNAFYYARLTLRHFNRPTFVSSEVGFRCVTSAP